MPRSRPLITLLFLGLLGLGGCGTDYYRMETTLHSDGRVDRAVYQPREVTPTEAQRAELWETITYAPRMTPDEWPDSISELPQAPPADCRPYFAAWGTFDSAEAVPEHFVKPSPDKTKAAILQRNYSRTDYGLVVEYSWKETLTDIVTLDDVYRATDELADLGIDIARRALSEALGPDYEVSPVLDWMQSEGRRWLHELVGALLDICGRRRERSEPYGDVWEQFEIRWVEICARHGLKLTDEQGKPLQGDAQDRAVEEFCVRKLQALVRRKDGKPVSEDTIRRLVKSPYAEDGNSEDCKSPLDRAVEQIVAERFDGNEEAFKKYWQTLLSRILGVHRYEILFPPREVHYRLVVPGVIVETSGRIASDSEVRWRFDATAAYPFGYSMTCRSLETKEKAQRDLLGAVRLRTRNELQKYVDLIDEDEDLRKAIIRSTEVADLAPLREYRQEVEGGNAPDARKRIRQLWEMLALPE